MKACGIVAAVGCSACLAATFAFPGDAGPSAWAFAVVIFGTGAISGVATAWRS